MFKEDDNKSELRKEQHQHVPQEPGQYDNQETENKDKAERSAKDEELHDSLVDQGMDEDHAKGIAYTPDAGHGAEDAKVYEDMSMEDLYAEAKKAGIDGYYEMRRNDIVMALKQSGGE